MAVLRPPVEPALASAQRHVPRSTAHARLAFEPKLDGWRGLLFSGEGVLQSRRGTNLSARFPELVAAARPLGDVVLDGEIVALREGRLDFVALAAGAHRRSVAGVVVYYVAFDLLAHDEHDLRDRPYAHRRARLEEVMTAVAPPLQLVPSTTDREQALAWMRPAVSVVGIEGLVAKCLDRPYRAGRGGDWIKVRQHVVVDAVVIGVTGPPEHPSELVLARPDAHGRLRRIGLSHPLPQNLRTPAGHLVTTTGDAPRTISTGLFGAGAGTEYLPVHPSLVVEVRAEGAVLAFSNRLRPTVQRLRPDLTPDDLTPSP
ncbi:hypothetical protein [Saccharothrix sp.]|uniref:ATP-dependent DNA ligase n=1 Tax=Saccharothrix sp. TaxID=1873460 RepID=UPI002811B542|nr:hypothetical protein [Saccharothrix sp.]